jgi:hypothetical protein
MLATGMGEAGRHYLCGAPLVPVEVPAERLYPAPPARAPHARPSMETNGNSITSAESDVDQLHLALPLSRLGV